MCENAVTEEIQFCKILVGNTLLGVEVSDLREINSVGKISPIHHTPEEVLGYMNIRGQIHLILDIRPCLDIPVSKESSFSDSKVLIFKSQKNEPVGILVDQVLDIGYIHKEQIETKGMSNNEEFGSGKAFLKGICKLEGRLMFLFDLNKILESVETKLKNYLIESGFLNHN